MERNRGNHNSLQGDKLNLRKEVEKYLVYWPWFILSVSVFLLLGYLHLRYTTPVFSAKASIIIKDESGKGAGEAIYADLGISGIGTSNFDNEIGIIQSRYLMREAVKSLGLHIQYFIEGNVRAVEIYEDVPFSLQILKLDEANLKRIGSASFEVSKIGENIQIRNLSSLNSFFTSPGKLVDLNFADVVFAPNSPNGEIDLPKPVVVKISDPDRIAAHFLGKISLRQVAKGGGLMELEMKDPVKEKARDLLDQLILEYNRDAIEDKNLVAGNTANFINERLAIINQELDSVETGKEIFKEQNHLTDIQAQSQMFIQNANDYNKRRQEVGTQLELSNAMLEYITSNSNSGLLPTNLGISESGVNQHIEEYNDLVLERNRILRGSSEKNPVVMRLNSNIDQIKGNVVQSLKTMRSNLQIAQEDLNRQASSIGSQIYAVPSKEREYRGIERQQNIKETLYLFLLQKREENSLSLAVTEPKAKIVDRAYYQDWPVSPNTRNIYLGTIILGFFIPFSVVYLKEMLNNKIRGRSDIENFTREISLLGLIPKVSAKARFIKKNDRSVLAESFRILVTNLQYFLINSRNKKGGITILVTSTVKGEGKTFASVNLGVTLANTGKKVLIVGADLRNPKLQSFAMPTDASVGLSDYLVQDDIPLEDLIVGSNLHSQLDILISGNIPPNPYELLKQEKTEILFSHLENLYDYVIVDTAPSMLVADTFLLTKFADLILFILRAGYTEKELLEFSLEVKNEGKFENISFVLNDIKPNDLGYGNKYGYGYGVEKKGFWKRAKSSPKSKNLVNVSEDQARYA